MSMRKYGTISDVYFTFQGFSIWTLSFEYELSYDGETIIVCANNMTELRKEIAKLITEVSNEQHS